ncbi:hypothetical protein FOA52_005944 [Chlamydomonas sp. UWO 241]|nr:hypothetical protein FOA52_005944 [Chlamydomonas sp. UWO 241]
MAHGLHGARPMQQHCTCASPTDDLGLEEGWGVEPAAKAPPRQQQAGRAPQAARKASPTQQVQQQQQQAPPAAAPARPKAPGASKKKGRSPFLDMKSPEGVLGLTLLQQKLMRAEAGQVGMTAADQQELLDSLPAPGKAPRKGLQIAAAAPSTKPRTRIVYEDDDGNEWDGEEEDAEDSTSPSFELTLNPDQDMEYVEYDRSGNVSKRVASVAADAAAADDDEELDEEELLDDGDEFDFADSADGGWGQLGAAAAAAGMERSLEAETVARDGDDGGAAARLLEDALGDQGASSIGIDGLGDDGPEEWGLDELSGQVGPDGRRVTRSLSQELGVTRGKGSRPRGVDEDMGVNVTWGGNAATSRTDLDEQERLLSRMFKPHKVKKLMAHQRMALEEAEKLKRGASSREGTEARLHRQLRIVQGSAANKRILSSAGAQTRPMMEKVRQAIFNMIQSQAGTVNHLPPDARWLDLFAGTGSVGLEALSRGVRECHFVEMDPWVTRNVLGKNITTCGFNRQSIVHTNKAEEFLKRAVAVPRFAGGAFDFVSMCPPYLLVSYPELFDLVNRSQLLHENSIMFVEYPRQLSHQVPDVVGPLVRVRDREYGRTLIAVYGPSGGGESSDGDEGVDY